MGFASWQRYCTASSSGRQPNFAALNRGRHPCSAGRPSRWALAHISSSVFCSKRIFFISCCLLVLQDCIEVASSGFRQVRAPQTTRHTMAAKLCQNSIGLAVACHLTAHRWVRVYRHTPELTHVAYQSRSVHVWLQLALQTELCCCCNNYSTLSAFMVLLSWL